MALSQMHQQIKSTPSSRQHPLLLLRPSKHTAPCSSVTLSSRTQHSSRGLHICRAVEEQQQQSVAVRPEAAVPGMISYLDSLKWSQDGLVPVIVQVCRCWAYLPAGTSAARHKAAAGQSTHPPSCMHSRPYMHELFVVACEVQVIQGNCLLLLQHVDTGELLMQAYADRAALSETLQTK